MGGLLIRLQEWWRTTDKTQRVATLGGVAVLLFMLIGVYIFASRPKYETLYSNLSDQDRGVIMAELEGQGIDAVSEAGVIKVPVGMKDKLHAKLAVTGKQPRTQGSWGQGEFDKIPMGSTPTVERERLKTIAEGEISRTIEQLDGISSAHVQITLPPAALFQSDDKPPTAAVTVVESSPGALTQENGRVIAMLVSNAVPKMEAANVVVTNQQMKFLWNGADQQGNSTSTASKKLDLEKQISKEHQNQLQATLDHAFGVGATSVIARAEVDMDSLKSTEDLVTPTEKPLDVTTSNEKVDGKPGNAVGGAAGAGSNIGAPTSGGGGGDKGTYLGNVKTANFGASRRVNISDKAVGTLKSLNLNVVVDTNRNVDKAKVEQILRGHLGSKLQVDANGVPLPNQPFAYMVTDVAFDTKAFEDARAAEDKAASQARMQQLISILPIVALLFVALLVVKQVGKFAKTYLPAPAAVHRSDNELAMSADGSMHHNDTPQSLESIANQLLDRIATEDGVHLPASALGDHGHSYPHPHDDVIEIEEIKDKVHVPLEQLRKMATEKPQVVAMLVKSMLLEERR